MTDLRAILVCVEFDDLLAITLPYNRHHFKEIVVVSTPSDYATHSVAKHNNAGIFMTEAFYERHAFFNKWLALEQGLDSFGRHGLLVLMDVDILWPRDIDHSWYERGWLYTPRRRLWKDLRRPPPPEEQWKHLPIMNEREWAGYSQIFYADDPHLPEPPWHETNWIHAGGADSFFQNLWPRERKRRPEWACVHLGVPGRNWCGRTTPRASGEATRGAEERRRTLDQILALRRVRPGYAHEKLPDDHPL